MEGCYWRGRFWRNGYRTRPPHTCDNNFQVDKDWRYNITSDKYEKLTKKWLSKNPMPSSIRNDIERYLGTQDMRTIYNYWCGVEGCKFTLMMNIGLPSHIAYMIYNNMRACKIKK